MPQPNELPPIIPPGSVLGDPARRERLASSAGDVIQTTATLAVIARAIPHPAGRAAVAIFAGVHSDDGGVGPNRRTLFNFAPIPFGFLDADAAGLPRNYYLPRGVTQFVPKFFDDKFGGKLGLPEQRAEDEAAAIINRVEADVSRQAAARAAVANETNETLADLAAGRGGFTRAGVVRSLEGVGDTAALERAAAEELARRGASTRPGALVDPAAVGSALAARISAGQLAPVIPAPSGGGPVDPTATPPVTFDGQGAERGAKPPMKNLATERADP